MCVPETLERTLKVTLAVEEIAKQKQNIALTAEFTAHQDDANLHVLSVY